MARLQDIDEGDSPILKVLGYLDRPRNALATAVHYLTDDDPESGFFQGAKEGFMGDKQTAWTDVLGMRRASEEDSTPEWLLRKGAELAGDVVLDPLNILFGTGAISKGLGAAKGGVSLVGRGAKALGSEKASNWLAGTAVGSLYNRSPNKGLEEIISAKKRELSLVPAQETALASRKAIDEFLKANPGATDKEVFNALEMLQSPEAYGNVEKTIQPLRDIQESLFDRLGKRIEEWNLGSPHELQHTVPTKLVNPEGRYLPHRQTPDAVDKAPWRVSHRDIKKWVDEEGNPVKIGELADKRTGITQKNGQFYVGETPVFQREATLAEKMAEYKDIPFQTDPVLGLYGSIKELNAKLLFHEIVDAGMKAGVVAREPLDATWRELRIPSFKGLWASKAEANRLEGMAGQLLDRGTVPGSIPDLLRRANQSGAGQLAQEMTGVEKRNLLASFGWLFPNIVSNTVQQASIGHMNPLDLILNKADGVKILMEKGDNVFEGITNKELRREYAMRDLSEGVFTDAEAKSYLSQATQKGPQTERRMKMIPGMPDIVAKGGQGVANLLGKYNQLFLGFGGKVDSIDKYAVATNWLKKNAPDFATRSPEEKALLLDRAADEAKRVQLDYKDVSPTLEEATKVAVPFGKWSALMGAQTGKALVQEPQTLANVGRVLDATFQGPSEQDKSMMDPWMREQGPVVSALGKILPEAASGNPMTLLSGRFLPMGQIEQAVSRPTDFLAGMINPLLRAPTELAMNRSSFKDRPIDQVAGSGLKGLTAPLTGGQYELSGRPHVGGVQLPAAWEYLVSQSPISRHLNEADVLSASTGAWENLYQKSKIGPTEALVWYMTGGKQYEFDRARALLNRVRESDTEGRGIKAKMKYAASKGDAGAVQHYTEQLQMHVEKRARAPWLGESGS